MIDRLRAWRDRSGPTPTGPDDPIGQALIVALRAELADARKSATEAAQLASDRGFVVDKLNAENAKLSTDNKRLTLRLTTTHDTIAELHDELRKTRAELVERPCVCGGDPELHWRRRANDAEQRAARDRANAVAMANRLAAAEGRPVTRSVA